MLIIEGVEFEELNSSIMLNEKPKLSVWCNTYNHCKYIEECLDNIINQKTNFLIEIIVFDDASTDGTQEIIRDYCKKYPCLIHGFLAKDNTYSRSIIHQVMTEIQRCYLRGIYAAICEGDDYWCDSNKLQMQVDYMDNHPKCFLTMHNAQRINYRTQEKDLMKAYETSHTIEPEEIICQRSGIWPTASMVGKKEVLLCEPFFFECGIGDWPMQLYACSKGEVFYFDKVMSVYRYMHKGSWSERIINKCVSRIIHSIKMIDFLKKYDEYTDRKFHNALVSRINEFYYDIVSNNKTDKHTQELIRISDVETNYKYHYYFMNSIGLDRQINDYYFLSDTIFEMIKKNEKIYIMGKGHFSDILTKQLENNGIEITGYVISDNQIKEETTVLYLSEYKAQVFNSLLLVAIGARYYLDVLDNIQKFNISYYCFPFLIDA